MRAKTIKETKIPEVISTNDAMVFRSRIGFPTRAALNMSV